MEPRWAMRQPSTPPAVRWQQGCDPLRVGERIPRSPWPSRPREAVTGTKLSFCRPAGPLPDTTELSQTHVIQGVRGNLGRQQGKGTPSMAPPNPPVTFYTVTEPEPVGCRELWGFGTPALLLWQGRGTSPWPQKQTVWGRVRGYSIRRFLQRLQSPQT